MSTASHFSGGRRRGHSEMDENAMGPCPPQELKHIEDNPQTSGASNAMENLPEHSHAQSSLLVESDENKEGDVEDDINSEESESYPPQYSLFIFKIDHPLRRKLISCIKSKYFERVVLALITLNCLTLALDSKRPHFNETKLGKGLRPFEYLFLGVFTAEMLIKILAMGLVLGPNTYMRDGWNLMDMIVVILGWLAFFPSFGNYTAIRVVRVFRPLRTITGIEGMRILVVTLFKSLPMLLDVMILCAFAFFIFGIVGVQLFSGLLQYRCAYPVNVTAETLGSIQYVVPPNQEDSVCSGRMAHDITWLVDDGAILAVGGTKGYGRSCPTETLEYPYGLFCTKTGNPNFGITSFDNILWAWLTIFQCISLEGWTDIMYKIQDSNGPWAWVYFTVLIVFGSFFAVNLALAVLYLYFTNPDNADDSESGEDTVHDFDRNPISATLSDNLSQHINRMHKSRVTKFCYRIQSHQYFEGLTMVLIVVNTIVMAAESHKMPEWQERASENINIMFSMYFAFEMVVKVIGLSLRGYVKDKMNVFDGVVVIASLIEIAVMFTPNVRGLGGSLSIMRTFRLMRVFKLARSWKELNKIINTIFKSLASIAYLSLILLLFIFITALLGMQVFGYQFQFCDHVDGSKSICPPGLDPLKDCPAHYNCYVPCEASQHMQWIEAHGSPYNNLAFCEKFTEADESVYLAHVGKSTVSRHNFDTMLWSIITIFQILTGEDWNSVMYDGMRSTSSFASLYFVMMVVLGNYIILNLFLAILLDNFAGVSGDESDSEGDADEETEASKIELPSIPDASTTYNSLIGTAYSEDEDPREESPTMKPALSMTSGLRSPSQLFKASTDPLAWIASIQESLEGKSLWIFGTNNMMRIRLAMVVGHRNFEHVIVVLICLSSITLALDSPTLNPKSSFKKVLNILDTVFVVIFALEAIIKICVCGFLMNGRSSYLRNPWNVLDFIIVVVGIILLFGKDNDELTSLRALRTLRALRPIRMASRNEGMKVVVNALFQSIPPIFNVLLVCLLFFLIFGILGVNLLKGKYYYCMDENGKRLDAAYILPDGQKIDQEWCQHSIHNISSSYYHSKIGVDIPQYELRHKWVNKEVNFDNIGMAMMALFEMATLEMWLVIMYDGVDAAGIGQQPTYNNNPYICIFFVLFIIVGSFFVLNLFVGVTIDKFNEMQEKQEGRSLLLTSEQEQWLHIQKLLAATKPSEQCKPPDNHIRRRVFKVVTSQTFDAMIMGMIMLNIIFMSMTHSDMSQPWVAVLLGAGIGFTVFFTIEAAAKLFALGIVNYFKDAWNAFDFCVVVLSIIGVVVDLVSHEQLPVVSLLRVFRVARMFRLIPKAKGLRTLFQTLVYSLPALVNVGSVLFLFFFIFAIMGMNLFGVIRHGDYLNRHANFETFPQALLLLFRMATGESWNGIMHDCMRSTHCIALTQDFASDTGVEYKAGTYLSRGDFGAFGIPSSLGEDRCGPPKMATATYFMVFVIVCAFILLNLVIAVILDNFQSSSQSEAMPVGRSHLVHFTEVWSDLDPDATSFIPTVKLSTLISELDPPLGVKGMNSSPIAIQNIIMSVDIPNRNNKVHFLETLHALGGRVAGTQLPEDEEQKIHEKMYSRLPDDMEFPKYTAAHFYAALYVQAAVRGFLARHKMKDVIEDFNEDVENKKLMGLANWGQEDEMLGETHPAKTSNIWDRVRSVLSSLRGSSNAKGKVGVVQGPGLSRPKQERGDSKEPTVSGGFEGG